ncbi:MAG: ABC transporter permease subunit [Acidobacteria bacterium]|nr:ABC transporter permease subunit [Acidobacteriota bacterium]MBI3425218.1 ABC transporter permease subunit [Acidobacteriota bacterium]
MRSPKLLILAGKEWRELLASRAYWLLLLVIGPLVGQGFISVVHLYAEASGANGAPAALPQGLTPLDGMLAPTWAAYELAVTLLLPFVAIRLIAAEKESGALKLALQFPASLPLQLTAKVLALLTGWLLAWLPGLLALILWKSYGGHLAGAETLNLFAGHWLRMLLSAAVAMAAAALTESAASAAIVTLSFTLGTWALDFIALGRGGWLAAAAAYTPAAALRFFEQGLLRVSTVGVLLACTLAGLALTVIWWHSGQPWRNRCGLTLGLAVLSTVALALVTTSRASWDVSENRRNSFTRGEETALRQIRAPLRITINLAAEDPRLMDYERSILNKLRRLLPQLTAVYAAQSRTGLFEESGQHYGEIWYEYQGRKVMNRSTTEPIVLEQLFQLVEIAPPPAVNEPVFPGYPLAAQPRYANWLFYFLWPLAVLAVWWLTIFRRS